MTALTPIFSALSDPYRFEIIERLLRDGETPAGQISDMFEISGPAVSRHLTVLHKAGLVARRISGQQRLYSVRPDAIRKVSDWTMNHRDFWEAGLDRLETALREDLK